MIYLGADHGGYKYKELLKKHLHVQGYQVTDVGAHFEEPVDDYPPIAEKTAKFVTEDPNNRGILLCRSGVGMCIAANKIKGIRAATVWSEKIASAARGDDNVNVLCLAADYHDFEEVKKMVKAFLDTSFRSEDRFKRRLKQIEELEH